MEKNVVIAVGLDKTLSAQEKKAVVDKIKSLKEVFNVSALKEESKNPDISCLYFAYLNKGAAAEKAIEKIEKIDGVRYAHVPAPRRLL